MINTRSESAAERPAFREAFRRRRCLVPGDGFFEWRREGRVNQPYRITPVDQALFAFAGIWENWRSPVGDWVTSFAILTTAANDYVRVLHDRMPVVVLPVDYERWLDSTLHDPEAVADILVPLPSEAVQAAPVSTRVNQHQNDDEQIVAPTGPPLMRL